MFGVIMRDFGMTVAVRIGIRSKVSVHIIEIVDEGTKIEGAVVMKVGGFKIGEEIITERTECWLEIGKPKRRSGVQAQRRDQEEWPR